MPKKIMDTASSHDPINTSDRKVRQAELAIGWVLRIGAGTSIAIIVVGLVLTFVHHPMYFALHGNISYLTLTRFKASFARSIPTLISELKVGDGRAVVILGIIVLILTPVARVVASIITFAYERDTHMTIVTLFVLLVLIASFALAFA